MLERVDQEVSRPGQPFTVQGRTIDGIALGLSGSAADHSWQASVRNDRNSQFGNQTTGSLGWGYAFTPAWSAGASWGTSFVAPSFNQLYWPGWGNPNLRPEEGEHAELSLRWKSGRHSVRGAWFDSRIRGFITSGPAPVNVPRTRIDGVVLAYEGRWNEVALGASLDRIDPRNETSGASFGKMLPRRSKLALRTHADWSRGPWSVGATWSAFSERFDDTANTQLLPGYGTVDVRADWRFGRDWSLGARLNNVRRQGVPDRARLQPAGTRVVPQRALRAALSRQHAATQRSAPTCTSSSSAGKRAASRARPKCVPRAGWPCPTGKPC